MGLNYTFLLQKNKPLTLCYEIYTSKYILRTNKITNE
ncbi:hypothetical protein FLACHUCJ7_01166 [Flavobacterium chungangense]|uniref:Uncharacterized protein n=1 Tax=Flavobacterium chungangense TaxID=554283 RepID=A0A6V6YU04_9FLAO|nr:hypothetical protein FLACHUCJ7_01166 [Flavobacterium chungangense]